MRAPPLDSRFRGNDEELVMSPDFFTHSLGDGILKTRPMGKPVYDPGLPRGGRRCEAGPVTLA